MCAFPGEPENGYVTPSRFAYPVGDGVAIVCAADHEPLGPAFIYCTSRGSWSSPLSPCRRSPDSRPPDLDSVVF